MAGGSAPCEKIPSRPRVVVGYSIIRPLFLHLPQQYHPVHCRLALRHSHTRADWPVVEQVKCRVQLHHRSIRSQTRLLWRLTVELIPNYPIGVSPFRFFPSRWPDCCQLSRHTPSHSSAVPDPIRNRSGALATGAHTTRTQPRSLGALEATLIPWCVCVSSRL